MGDTIAVELSDCDLRIIGLIACGADTAAIEEELNMTKWTLRDRIRKLRDRYGAASMLELPDCVRALGVTLPDCTDEWVDADDEDE